MVGQNSTANDKQVGGNHYKTDGKRPQHWDVVLAMGWDYFQGNITKYVDRHARKGGFKDLLKAGHYLEKYMEVHYPNELAEYRAQQEAKELQARQKKCNEAHDDEVRHAAQQETDEAIREYETSVLPGPRTPPAAGQLWRNIANGNVYDIISTGVDATSVREGLRVIVYKSALQQVYVRAATEFVEKFELFRK